jgi:hypothetical protein
MHCPPTQRGVGGGSQGGIGPSLQPEQYLSAEVERTGSNESATPYQSAAYEQPCSHRLRAAITTHSLALEQPYWYFFRITSRSAAYA